jgi:hypothetical protein
MPEATTAAHSSGSTIKLPIFGTVKKKTAAIVGIGSVAGVLGFIWYRQRKAASAAAAASTASTASTAAMQTDPAGNQCVTLDPQTGYCPGTTEDTQALEALTQESAAGELSSGSSSDYVGLAEGTGNTGPGTFTSNANWAQYVEEALGSDGTDAIAAAIGLYLNGQPLSSSQVTIIQEAVAIGGNPPVSGASGYPPNYQTAGGTSTTTPAATTGTCPSGYTYSATQTGASGEIAATGGSGYCEPSTTSTSPAPTPTPTATKVAVPNVIGMNRTTGFAEIQNAGLTYTETPAAKAGVGYIITATAPKAGTQVASGSKVTCTIKQAPAGAGNPVSTK